MIAVPDEGKDYPAILYQLHPKTLAILGEKKINKIEKPFICVKKNQLEILVVGIKAASVYHYFESGFLEASRVDFLDYLINQVLT